MGLKESADKAVDLLKNSPPEAIAESARETYPDISAEDAQRINSGLLALLESRTPEEYSRQKKAYKALHEELKKKYRKSGE